MLVTDAGALLGRHSHRRTGEPAGGRALMFSAPLPHGPSRGAPQVPVLREVCSFARSFRRARRRRRGFRDKLLGQGILTRTTLTPSP